MIENDNNNNRGKDGITISSAGKSIETRGINKTKYVKKSTRLN